MSHDNAPILVISSPVHASSNQNPDNVSQLLKQKPPVSQKQGNSNKPILNRVRKSKQNDKSDPLRRNEVTNSYSNVSLISLEKKLHDESGLDNGSNTSRSIFSTESPRDGRTIPSIKQKSYYLGGMNVNDAYRANPNNIKGSYAGKSVHPSITLDESNANIQSNQQENHIEEKPKNAGKAQSMNFIQSKRSFTIGNKFYHGFKKTSVSHTLIDQAESFDLPRLLSPQQKDLKTFSENIDKQKQAEDPAHVPRPPSKGLLKKARTLAAPVLDHRRPKKVATELSSIAVKTNIDLDIKAYQSLPNGKVPQSMTNLQNQDSSIENMHFETEPDLVSKHRILKPEIERKARNRVSLNGKASKENDLSSQTDLSHGQNFHHNIKIPLKPLSNNVNSMDRPIKRVMNSKAPNSEMRGSSKDDLMRRFNEIVTYQTQPAQTGNVLQEKNRNEGQGLRSIISTVKDKENSMRRPLKQHDENKPIGVGAQKDKKPEEVNTIDAKIMLLQNKIKDKEYKRKTRRNQHLEESENMVNGIPLKSKLGEHMENRAEMEEEMKKRLLVMRKIQLYDILMKQRMGKKLPKEALRLVKAEYEKVNQELDELKLHVQ